jgi:hypothetical protein
MQLHAYAYDQAAIASLTADLRRLVRVQNGLVTEAAVEGERTVWLDIAGVIDPATLDEQKMESAP